MRSIPAHDSTFAPRQRLRVLCVTALLTAGATLMAEGPRIVPLVRDGQVLVSFEMADAFTPEVRAAIQSGMRTTFTYTIDLRLEVPAWADRTIATSTVGSSVKYDNLTRRHTVERTLDGRVVETKVTEDESVVRQWMTGFRLPLFRTSKLEPNREYYVRVNATARPSSGSMLWPWGSGVTGLAKFTFLP